MSAGAWMLILIALAAVVLVVVVWRAVASPLPGTVAAPGRLNTAEVPGVSAVVTIDVESDAHIDAIIAELDRNRPIHEAAREARILRGRDVYEWRHEVARLKTEGKLEEALSLAYECSDLIERDHVIRSQLTLNGDQVSMPAYWSKDIAIILRRMKDFDAEVRYLEEKLDADPGNLEISARLSKARILVAKQAHGQI